MNKNSMIYRYMFDLQYRFGRHFVFIIILAIISFNQTLLAFRDVEAEIGYKIYYICVLSLLQYLLFTYINYFYLIPQYLDEQRYKQYIGRLILWVFTLPLLSIIGEYLTRILLKLPHRIESYTSPLIIVDCLSAGMILLPCFLAMAAIVLFRKWYKQNEYAQMLEHNQMEVELNELKGKVRPVFFSQSLQKASKLSYTNPKKASQILMALSQLLRYQLYDSNHSKVLLSSEIGFIYNFLNISQLLGNLGAYQLDTEGTLDNVFVPPLLFLDIIQHEINQSVINLKFIKTADSLLFECNLSSRMQHIEEILSLIKDRLDIIYPDKHTIKVSEKFILLELTI